MCLQETSEYTLFDIPPLLVYDKAVQVPGSAAAGECGRQIAMKESLTSRLTKYRKAVK